VGRALCLQLAKKGSHVCIVDIDKQGISTTRKLLEHSTTGYSIYPTDLSDRVQIEAMVNKVIEDHKTIDILINNAAVSIDANLIDHSDDDIEWITSINYLAPLYCSRYFLPHLLKSDEAHIVFVSSAAGLQGFPGKSTYSASKFALTGLSEALSTELYETHVNVSIAYLGPVNTDMLDRSRFHNPSKKTKIDKYLKTKGYTPEYVARKIISAIEKRKTRILITKQSKTLDIFKRLFPAYFNRQIGKNKHNLPA